MGTRRAPSSGMIVFDDYFAGTDFLAANTATATTSDYTEAGSVPGQVTYVDGQSLVPVVTNAQDDTTVGVRVQRSGFAGRAGLAYSVDQGSTWRGWNGVRPIGFEGIGSLYTTTDDWAAHGSCVIPSTQTIVTAYAEVGTGSVYVRTRAEDTEAWSSAVEVTTSSANAVQIVCLPESEMLVLIRIGSVTNRISTFFSADAGATWKTLASASDVGLPLGFTPNPEDVCAVAVGESQILLLVADSSLEQMHQYASPDGGITWSYIGEFDDVSGGVGAARALDGSAVVSYRVYTGSGTVYEVYTKRFASAYVPWISAGTSVSPFTTTTSVHTAVAVDADDTYILAISGSVDQLRLYQSTDHGASWTGGVNLNTGDTIGTTIDNFQLVPAAGRLVCIHQSSTGGGGVDGSLTAIKFASWSSREWDDVPTVTWVPIEYPDAMGWSATGSGTPTLTLAHLRIVTSADTLYYRYDAGGHSFTPGLHVIMSVGTDATSSADALSCQVVGTSAGATYTLRCNVWDDTLAFVDGITGTSIVEVALDCTTDVEILIYFTGAGSGRALYKRPNDIDWTAVAAVSSHSFSDGGALETAAWARFGVSSAASLTGWVRFAAFYDEFQNPRSGTALEGKRLSSLPYPIPGVVDADDHMAHLSVRGGLGLTDETYQVVPDHTYALAHALVGPNPDPVARHWRSADDASDVIIAWDLGGSTFVGGALAVVFERINFRLAYLEYHDGSAWQTLGTYDGGTGFVDLAFERAGGSIYPDLDGTPDSSRMLQEQEFGRHGRGYAILDDGLGGDPVLRSICSNTQGWWTAETTARAVVNLDGVDDSEPLGGNVTLVAPGGVLIAYLTAFAPRRRWRIRIPAQDTVEGYFRAGLIGLGRVVPFGLGFGWGNAQEQRPQFSAFRNAAGAETRSALGEDARAWTLDWSDGVPMRQARSEVSGDYIGVSGGLALEAEYSTPWQLSGILTRTQSQTVPVAAVAQLPSTSTTITDRTLWLYGLLSNSLGTSTAYGREGVNEHVRIETLRVDGYPGG